MHANTRSTWTAELKKTTSEIVYLLTEDIELFTALFLAHKTVYLAMELQFRESFYLRINIIYIFVFKIISLYYLIIIINNLAICQSIL
jgi:hypothetical protein